MAAIKLCGVCAVEIPLVVLHEKLSNFDYRVVEQCPRCGNRTITGTLPGFIEVEIEQYVVVKPASGPYTLAREIRSTSAEHSVEPLSVLLETLRTTGLVLGPFNGPEAQGLAERIRRAGGDVVVQSSSYRRPE